MTDSEAGKGTRSFQKLPIELLIKIATILPPVDRASLAIVNRKIHSIIHNALDLGRELSYDLLMRLDGDGVLPSQYLCQWCRQFHNPRKSRAWSAKEGRRSCVYWGISKTDSPYLPSQIYYDILISIYRSRGIGRGGYTIHHLASSHQYTDSDARISIEVSARLVDERYLLKTEMMLAPASRRSSALEGIPRLQKLFDKYSENGRVCQHATWANIWPFIFQPDDASEERQEHQKQTPGDQKRFELDAKSLHECLWTHERSCWIKCNAGARLERNFEKLWSCEICSTDYNVASLHLKNKVNLLVFTSWKSLGKGYQVDDPEWQGHMHLTGDNKSQARSSALWSIAPEFEGEGGVTEFIYYPSAQDLSQKLFS